MNDFAVIVSSKAEDFQIFFPQHKCHNLMEVDLEGLPERNVLYIERDYYTGFDFNYFLQYSVDKVNLGLIFDEAGNWPYGFDTNYMVDGNDSFLKESFSFSGVALFEKEYFLKEFGLDFMLKAESVAKSIPCPKISKPATQKAIFLDRDGILIEDTGYPHKEEHLKIRDDVYPLLKWGKENNYKLVIVSNQAGIARGKFSLDDYQNFSNLMLDEFKKADITFDGVYCSPCHPEGQGEYAGESFLRKPWPGMVVHAVEDHLIDVTESIMIGDKASDVLKAPLLKQYVLKGNYDVPSESYDSFDDILSDFKSLSIR